MTEIPPIPPNSEFFREIVWGKPTLPQYPDRSGEHDCWVFAIPRADHKDMIYLDVDTQPIRLGWRPIIAAVAEVEWRRIAEDTWKAHKDMRGTDSYEEHAEFENNQAVGCTNAAAWRKWGTEESNENYILLDNGGTMPKGAKGDTK